MSRCRTSSRGRDPKPASLTPRSLHRRELTNAVAVGRSRHNARPRSLQWRDLLRRYEIVDSASVVLAERVRDLGLPRPVAGRSGSVHAGGCGGAAPFVRIVAPAIRARLAATFEVPRRPGARDLRPVVIMLDDDLEVVGRTAATSHRSRIVSTGGCSRAGCAHNGTVLSRFESVDPPHARGAVRTLHRTVGRRAAWRPSLRPPRRRSWVGRSTR
jgi:hypothetical protein